MMEDWQRALLDNSLLEITKSLDIRDTILKLRARNILNEDDEQLIMNDSVNKIDSEKRQKIVDILKTRGKRAYWAFCHIVRNKTPFIFDCLHKCENENDKVEEVCLDCTGEENLSNCCNSCTGLVNVLKTSEFGVFVEKPEEIIEIFKEVNKQKAENEKLSQQNQELVDYKIRMERDVFRYEKQLSNIKTENVASNIEKEKAYESIRALQQKLDGEPLYANSTLIDKLKSDFLDADSSGSEVSIERHDSNASLYKLKYETLEEILRKQKKDHDNVFTVLEEKLRTSDSLKKQLKDELKTHKDYIKTLDNEKLEFKKEKDHLLRKLYEKGNVLGKAKQDKSSLELLYTNQKTTINSMEKENEELKLKIEKLEKENDLLKQSSDNGKVPAESDENNISNKYCRATDKIAVLKKIDDRFGIHFTVKKDLPLFGESRIIVSAFNPSNCVNESKLESVEVDDFVIFVNDENVEEADISIVRNIVAKNKDYMKLVTRKRRRISTSVNIPLYHRTFEDYRELGMRLAPYISLNSNSALRDCGLLDMDELVKINNKSVENLSIHEINSKLIKGIKQNQCEVIIKRLSIKTRNELNIKKDLTNLTPTPLPGHKQYTDSVSSEGSNSSPLAPKLPPRGSTSVEDLLSIDHNVAHQFTENYACGVYQRVVTKEYDQGGTLIKDSSNYVQNSSPNYENSTIQVEIQKESYETFGLHMAGGNKSGIFVEAVDNWKAAQKSNIQVGWKILQINGLSLEKVAFCYAHEVLQKFSSHKRVVFLFEQTPMDYYKRIMKKRPYDAFHVEALVNYNGRDERELSFSVGDVLCVDDSYFIEDPNQPYKWHAFKSDGTKKETGLIPRQISNRAPSSVKDHIYEDIDAPSPTEKQSKGLFANIKKKKVNQSRLYKILDPVGEVLV